MTTPFPYWLDHILVALGVGVGFLLLEYAGVVTWPLAGAMFYVGREIRDREKLGRWDRPGLLAPVLSMAALSAGLTVM